MTRTRRHPAWVAVDAPDAASALALEQRLAHLRAAAVGCAGTWTVELEDEEGRLDEVVASVRHWLRERELRATTLAVDGRDHVVAAAQADPFAPDEAELVLHHEP